MLGPRALGQRIGRSWIAAHVPHGGLMCLIDSVQSWNADTIECRTRTHTHQDNPLRLQGRLGVLCAVEYAAQAMAIHGAILRSQGASGNDAEAPVQGYLAALRDVQSRVRCLDSGATELEIVATRIAALPGGAIYDYEIRTTSGTLQSGRATLAFTAPASGRPGAES